MLKDKIKMDYFRQTHTKKRKKGANILKFGLHRCFVRQFDGFRYL